MGGLPTPVGAVPTAAPAGSPVAKAASPAPAAAPATKAAAVTPKGQVTYGIGTANNLSFLDPQDQAGSATWQFYQYLLHDELVKHYPGPQLYQSALAESYEIAPDFKSATFKLREGIKFHDGSPITPQDVKWTFENYRGTNATLLKSKTATIETPDARTVKFVFKDAFPDFLDLYAGFASGAGWIVPLPYSAPAVHRIEFPGFEDPSVRFSDQRLREAVSLAIDRRALSATETNGIAKPAGNWIPEEFPGALKVPAPERNLARAKQLLAEAGYPDGFEVEQITPVISTLNSLAERILTQLREVGIRSRLNDERWAQYKASTNPQERQRLMEEIQRYHVDNTIVAPVFQAVYFGGQSKRIANAPQEIWSAYPFFSSIGPYEDIRLRE